MSDTILSGDFTVYYLSENRRKQIKYTGSGTTYTVNELYSALQDLFDELTQLDDGTPMSAQTPTEYTIGIIDVGDNDPWFIDKKSVEYLTSGTLKTSSWTRANGSNTGIVKLTCESSGFNIVEGDIGNTITHGDGDSGTLLDVNTITYEVWIRPADYNASNDFDVTSGTLTCNGHTATVSSTGQTTGEMLWANIYSIGTIEDNTHLYVRQDGSTLSSYKDSTSDWWNDGHIDILVCVKECGTVIDEYRVTIFARQYSKTYDYFSLSLSNGGRNPIPLSTGIDLNNATGYRTFTGSSGGGTFQVDEIIYTGTDVSSANKKGVVTYVGGTTSAPVLQYYLIGGLMLNDFTNGSRVIGNTSNASCDAGTPSDYGPPTLSGVSITYGVNETFDIDEDGTTENYSIVIDCNNHRVASLYEWSKYITRRGSTATLNTDGIEGQFYIGPDYRIYYTALNGNVVEGTIVKQATSLAYGTVVAHNTTDKFLILRNSRGAFDSTSKIYVEASPANYVTGPTSQTITPIKAAPHGTFAGGIWFCAPGVVLDNVRTSENNSYQLVDDDGNVVTAPTKVTVTVGNSRAGDKIAVFAVNATGDIDKSQYNIAASQGDIGTTLIRVNPSVAAYVPGKTTGGVLFVVDDSAEVEHRYRYSGYSSNTFTLVASTGLTADSGTGPATIVDQSRFGSAKIGDIVQNLTRSNAVSYIASVVDASTVTISPTISGQTSGDSYNYGAVVATYVATDTVYVPFIHTYETTGSDESPGSESVSVTYTSDIDVRIRARHAGDIIPYEADSQITNTGMSNNIIRTADSIYS